MKHFALSPWSGNILRFFINLKALHISTSHPETKESHCMSGKKHEREPDTVLTEHARIAVFGRELSLDNESLSDALHSALEPLMPSFAGEIHAVEESGRKTTVLLRGKGAYTAAGCLVRSNSKNKPWSYIFEHTREWHCPLTSCRNILNFGPLCKVCSVPKPKNLDGLRTLWANEESNRVCFTEVTEDTVDVWKRTIGFASVVFSYNTFFLDYKKDNLSALANLPESRLWAIDCCTGSGAKCWLWSKDLDSFIDLYVKIPSSNRNAYEIIQSGTPCHMAYDLDMNIGGGIDAGKGHVQMVKDIGKGSIISTSSRYHLLTRAFICQLKSHRTFSCRNIYQPILMVLNLKRRS